MGVLIVPSAVTTPVLADPAAQLLDCSPRAANGTELSLMRDDGTAGSAEGGR